MVRSAGIHYRFDPVACPLEADVRTIGRACEGEAFIFIGPDRHACGFLLLILAWPLARLATTLRPTISPDMALLATVVALFAPGGFVFLCFCLPFCAASAVSEDAVLCVPIALCLASSRSIRMSPSEETVSPRSVAE